MSEHEETQRETTSVDDEGNVEREVESTTTDTDTNDSDDDE